MAASAWRYFTQPDDRGIYPCKHSNVCRCKSPVATNDRAFSFDGIAKEAIMKFIIIVLVIRYLFILLDRLNEPVPEEEMEGIEENEMDIHPSEYSMR